MSTILCQTCSSQLTPVTLRQSFIPPCCKTPICSACIRNNPRLREYIPCLRCGDLSTKDGESRVIRGRREQEWKAVDRDGGDVMFDADADDGLEGDEVDELGLIGDDRTDTGIKPSTSRGTSPHPYGIDESQSLGTGKKVEQVEEELETAEIRHTVARSDTVLAIARRYAADPHELLSLNDLPPTALTSNARILQTRKSIIISKRQVSKSLLSQAAPEISNEEDKKRQEERAVKRFQLVTKTVDPGVGKAYLSLQGKEDPHPLEMGSGEKLDTDGGVKKQGNLSKEDRAMEQWFEDDEWEGEASNRLPKKKDGKWTSVGAVQASEKSSWFGLKG